MSTLKDKKTKIDKPVNPRSKNRTSNSDMSKLSEPLKALINAAHSKPHTLPAPHQIGAVYSRFADDAVSKKIGLPAWLTASVTPFPHHSHPKSVAKLTANARPQQQ